MSQFDAPSPASECVLCFVSIVRRAFTLASRVVVAPLCRAKANAGPLPVALVLNDHRLDDNALKARWSATSRLAHGSV
jgi:hypothetical protein